MNVILEKNANEELNLSEISMLGPGSEMSISDISPANPDQIQEKKENDIACSPTIAMVIKK